MGLKAPQPQLSIGSARQVRGHRIETFVVTREEFNALRERLPRAARRDVDAAPPGHVGLFAQALTATDTVIATLRHHVPQHLAADGRRELARQLEGLLR